MSTNAHNFAAFVYLTCTGAKTPTTSGAVASKWWLSVRGELTHIFAVKGTFIQFLDRLDIFDVDDAEGLFPWKAEVFHLYLE